MHGLATSDRHDVLIVDDDAGIRETLAAFLRGNGFPSVDVAASGEEALEALGKHGYLLVVTDVSMPGIGGLDLLARVRAEHPDIDVALITGHDEIDYAILAVKNGAFDYYRKPFRFEEVLKTARRVAEKRYLQQRSLELERLRERSRAEERHVTDFMITLAGMIDLKSPYTRQHSDRTARISVLLAERLGLRADERLRIELGARLHDIGKIGVPDAILDKPGPLTAPEYAKMKEHPMLGAALVEPVNCLKPIVSMIRWHHENLDGTGYPDGLAGDEIPLDARIVRVADYWDAITSQRSYRSPMKLAEAISVIEQEVEVGRLDGDLSTLLFEAARSGRLEHARLTTD